MDLVQFDKTLRRHCEYIIIQYYFIYIDTEFL